MPQSYNRWPCRMHICIIRSIPIFTHFFLVFFVSNLCVPSPKHFESCFIIFFYFIFNSKKLWALRWLNIYHLLFIAHFDSAWCQAYLIFPHIVPGVEIEGHVWHHTKVIHWTRVYVCKNMLSSLSSPQCLTITEEVSNVYFLCKIIFIKLCSEYFRYFTM